MLLAWLALGAGCREAETGPVAELGRLHESRTLGPRLSIEREYSPCRDGETAKAGDLPPAACPAPPQPATERLLELAAEVSARVESQADPEALHAAGLLDLLWSGGSGNSLDRSISYLTTAARLSDEPAVVLSDLAAAYLVRADATGSPRDLLEALDAAHRAFDHDSTLAAARFNLAYAADRLTLDGEAAREWRDYARLAEPDGWAREATSRAAALAAIPNAPEPPDLSATAEEARAFARSFPREARLLGWDDLLGSWGEAVISGDLAGAHRPLRLARLMGHELASRGGDSSLDHAVTAIRESAGDPAALSALAAGHQAYAAGRALLTENRAVEARARFEAALAARPASSTLRGWLETYRAVTLLVAGQLDEAAVELGRVAEVTDARRFPALVGQAVAAMTTARMRAGRYEEALELAGRAAAHYERADEREAVGSQIYLRADTEISAGAIEAGYLDMHRALSVLRPYPRSVWRYNSLSVLGEAAADEGLDRAATRLLGEAVSAMDLAESPVHQVEARLIRSRILWASGETVRAQEDVRSAGELLEAVRSPLSRAWLQFDLRLAIASAAVATTPRAAAASLDSILSDPAGTGTTLRLLEALVARSEARISLDEREGALSDLERAASLVFEESEAMTSATLRMALLEKGREVFDRLALAELASGDATRALHRLERGRISFARGLRSYGREAGGIPRMQDGEVGLVYMLAGDTILRWMLRGEQVEVSRTVVGRAELSRTIDRVRASMELGAGGEVLGGDLAKLHDWLIGPLRDQDLSAESLLLITDGEIAGVPFPALVDRVTGRYLVEDHRLRSAPSLRDAAAGPARPPDAQGRAVFISDPGGARGLAGYAPLPGSEREVRALAAYYPRSELLSGESTGPTAVTGALRRSALFHFAGHAVFDEARPELSFLVLAGDRRGEPARLTASALDGLDLTDLQLVVLSACETLRSGGGRSGGFTGFAGILLGAGVGGVLGSLWTVEDAATAQLMIEFHRAFAASGDGPGALQTAQIRLLRSDQPELRTPAAWAAFRYAGR